MSGSLPTLAVRILAPRGVRQLASLENRGRNTELSDPLPTALNPPRAAGRSGGRMSKPRTVLVVDDEPGMRTLLEAVLRRAGFEVHQASDAEEALELFRTLELDAVIADVVMPGMDGVTLLEQLIGLDTDVAVVLMTGFGAIDTAVDAMRRGAADYITKPFKRKRVLEAIERALSRRKQREMAGSADLPVEESEPTSFEQSVLEFALENRMTLREIGDLYIDRVLSLSGGNKVQAARRLGINRRTLYRRGSGARELVEDESAT